jgi:hypothetical protein
VVFVSRRQGIAVDQEQNQHAQLRHIFSAPLGQLDIAPKLRTADRIARVQIPRSSKSA